MERLPVELWERITQLSRREDLISLSLVSSTLRDVARRTLAASINFDVYRTSLNYLDVLKFLRVQNLLPCVRKFVCTESFAVVPFEGMINLQLLSFTEYSLHFMTVDDQRKFVDAIRSNCTQLVDLEIEYHGRILDEYFSIPNLQKITWHEEGYISAAFISLGHASASTLTELDLTVWMNHVRTERYIALSNLRFPKLRVLTFGSGGQFMPQLAPDEDHTAQDAYTAFLYAHKTIERLTLTHRYIKGSLEEIYMPFNPSALPKDIFPNLKYLAAHPMQMIQFVESEANMFRQESPLETLCITDGLYDDLAGNFIDVCKVLYGYASKHGPVCIRRLIFHCRENLTLQRGDFEACMTYSAGAFPDLHTWEGDVPQGDTNLRVFRHFKKLRKLRVRGVYEPALHWDYYYPVPTASGYEADKQIDIKEHAAVWVLAQKHCHLLKEIHYGNTDDNGLEVKREGDQVVGLASLRRCLETSHD